MTQSSLFDILPKEDKPSKADIVSAQCFEINGVKIFPEFGDSDVWTSSKQAEQLFNKSKSTISEHLSNMVIKEWSKNSPHSPLLPQVRNFRTGDNACGGIRKNVKKYNLATIIQLGFKLNGDAAIAFQCWATHIITRELQESANPSLTLERAVANLSNEGRSDDWIVARTKSIVRRNEFTDEIKARIDKPNYGKLTNIQYKSLTGETLAGLKQEKGLAEKENLRDHSGELELMVLALNDKLGVKNMKDRNAKGESACIKCISEAGKSLRGVWLDVQDSPKGIDIT